MMALHLLNLAEIDPARVPAARTGLREGLALALRLGVLPRVISAVSLSGVLAHAEGRIEEALALLGLACRQPAWSNSNQRELAVALAEWALDPATVEAGLAKGAELDWEATLQALVNG
jgi:hypothetical protein